jgi:hypothetical protein
LVPSSGAGDDAAVRDGDISLGITSRIHTLLNYTSTDPERLAFATTLRSTSTAASEDVDTIGSTIATLLLLLQTDNMCIAACCNLLDLSDDLGIVDNWGTLLEPTSPNNYHDGDNGNYDTGEGAEEEQLTLVNDTRVSYGLTTLGE